MKIGMYNSYFDSYGGGERYMLTLAGHWSKTHEVNVFWDDQSMLPRAESQFHLDLSKVKTVPNVFQSGSLIKKILVSSSYNTIVFLSDGSVPTSLATNNILHFQVPFTRVPMHPWKKSRYRKIVCNSEFTFQHLDQTLDIPRCVIYPPVTSGDFQEGKKENLILSVGRFSAHYQAKKQKVLIDAFQKGRQSGIFTGWKLVFAGGMLETDREYFDNLQQKIRSKDIVIIPNAAFNKIQSLYAKAKIYWHAAGYGETKPEHMEHFGISTVEAMSAGCIPVVYNGGGQTEIVKDGITGYLWKTVDELLFKTQTATEKKPAIVKKIKKQVEKFTTEIFCRKWDDLLSDL